MVISGRFVGECMSQPQMDEMTCWKDDIFFCKKWDFIERRVELCVTVTTVQQQNEAFQWKRKEMPTVNIEMAMFYFEISITFEPPAFSFDSIEVSFAIGKDP